jgi:sugar phosphate isomerase/epimerase
MEFAISTHLFVRHRLTASWLERTRDAGFSAVEIFCARQHLDYRNKSQLEELGQWFRDSELKLHSLHSPMYSDMVWGRSGPQAVIDITEPVKAKRIVIVDEIKRALEFAEFVPFRYLIQHLGVTGQELDERRQDSAFSSLEEIKVFASQRGVEVLLENTPNALSDAEQLNIFLARTHLNLNYCFDIGHAHMTGSIGDQFELMKERIRSTHIHDNDGKQDSHLYPEGGSIDWKKSMKLLATRQKQYPLLLELREQEGVENPIEKARETIDRLFELLNHDE